MFEDHIFGLRTLKLYTYNESDTQELEDHRCKRTLTVQESR